MIARFIIRLSDGLYRGILRNWLFNRYSAQQAHEHLLHLLAWADTNKLVLLFISLIGWLTIKRRKIVIGGIVLDYPIIIAAGFVKGRGFDSETEAIQAVQNHENIIAGWRSVPSLLGIVEFGSFTRFPRLGNAGEVIWRDVGSSSTQNRVGLKNAGAVASAAFLARNKQYLPKIFGVNIAISPNVTDPVQEQQEVIESLEAFITRDVIPTWFTLNISCPNTEDDPTGNQTETKTRHLCESVNKYLQSIPYNIPLWVKISPNLAPQQYAILMRVFTETNVKALIATNTVAQPSPTQNQLSAGIGGGKLHSYALSAIEHLQKARFEQNSPVDVIGCGGILDGKSYATYKARGIHVIQIWSALVYRGFLAPQIIESES